MDLTGLTAPEDPEELNIKHGCSFRRTFEMESLSEVGRSVEQVGVAGGRGRLLTENFARQRATSPLSGQRVNYRDHCIMST